VIVSDFDGERPVQSEEELLNHLRSARRGQYRAFILLHEDDEWLFGIHINGGAACVDFLKCTEGAEESWVADGMWSSEQRDVRFFVTSGFHGDAFVAPWFQPVPVDVVCSAAVEFLRSKRMPQAINWMQT
jgi:Immunity protein Imm1